MSKHTKGPWTLETYSGDPRYAEHYVKAGNNMVAIVSAANHGEWRDAEDEGESEFIANAKLIADAPDLLEAARAVCEAWSKFIDSFDYVPGIGDQAEDIEFQEMMRLRIAINKAIDK